MGLENGVGDKDGMLPHHQMEPHDGANDDDDLRRRRHSSSHERRLYRPGSMSSSLVELDGALPMRPTKTGAPIFKGSAASLAGSRASGRTRTPSGRSVRSRKASRAEYHDDLKPALERGLTRNLLLSSFVMYFGSSFIFGYNIGVLNQPGELISEFYNATYSERSGATIDSRLVTILMSLTTAFFFPGGMVGAFSAGYLADKVGRKRAIMISQLFALVGAAMSALCMMTRAPELLIAGRFVLGINCGFATQLVPMYLAEITPFNLRGAFGTGHQLFITIGIFVSAVFGLPQILGSRSGWPYLLLFNAAPALVSMLALPFIAESPRYLMIIKRKRIAAEKALRFYRQQADVSADLEEMETETTESSKHEAYTMKMLLSTRELLLPLFVAIMLQVIQQLSGINAVFFYSTSIFRNAGVAGYQIPYAVILTNLINVIMTIITVPVMDKAGRRPLLLYPMIMMIFILALLTTSLNLKHVEWMSYVSIIALILYVISFAVGLGPIPMMIGAELFRQGPRPRAMSLAGLTNWLFTTIVAISFPSIQNAIKEFTFIIFLVLMIFFSIFVYFLVPETKQRTFEEIASQFLRGSDIEVEEIVDEVFGHDGGDNSVTEGTHMLANGDATEWTPSAGAGDGIDVGDVRIRDGMEERAHLTKSEENICSLPA